MPPLDTPASLVSRPVHQNFAAQVGCVDQVGPHAGVDAEVQARSVGAGRRRPSWTVRSCSAARCSERPLALARFWAIDIGLPRRLQLETEGSRHRTRVLFADEQRAVHSGAEQEGRTSFQRANASRLTAPKSAWQRPRGALDDDVHQVAQGCDAPLARRKLRDVTGSGSIPTPFVRWQHQRDHLGRNYGSPRGPSLALDAARLRSCHMPDALRSRFQCLRRHPRVIASVDPHRRCDPPRSSPAARVAQLIAAELRLARHAADHRHLVQQLAKGTISHRFYAAERRHRRGGRRRACPPAVRGAVRLCHHTPAIDAQPGGLRDPGPPHRVTDFDSAQHDAVPTSISGLAAARQPGASRPCPWTTSETSLAPRPAQHQRQIFHQRHPEPAPGPGLLDYDAVAAKARVKPLIIVAGCSASTSVNFAQGCARSPTRSARPDRRYGALRRAGGRARSSPATTSPGTASITTDHHGRCAPARRPGARAGFTPSVDRGCPRARRALSHMIPAKAVALAEARQRGVADHAQSITDDASR